MECGGIVLVFAGELSLCGEGDRVKRGRIASFVAAVNMAELDTGECKIVPD
jgi:hypothetical protein